MAKKARIPLEYSSLELERSREREYERDRRKAIEDYNEATFGDRRPFIGPFIRIFVVAVVCAVLIVALPRKADTWALFATVLLFRLWEFRRYRR